LNSRAVEPPCSGRGGKVFGWTTRPRPTAASTLRPPINPTHDTKYCYVIDKKEAARANFLLCGKELLSLFGGAQRVIAQRDELGYEPNPKTCVSSEAPSCDSGTMNGPVFSGEIRSSGKPKLPQPISIEAYRHLVEQCAANRLNLPIANGSPFHARILINKLFEIATKEVVIVTGSLRDQTTTGTDVYGYEPVIEAARKFLADPSAALTIILQQGELHQGNKNRLLRTIINDQNRNGVVSLTTPPPDMLDSTVPHFMVADQFAYRIETGADAKDIDSIDRMTAVANFGDHKTGIELHAYFDEIVQFVGKASMGTRVELFQAGVNI
jgi:hypothetical protein